MKKKSIFLLILFVLLVSPVLIYAESLSTYGEAVTKANNYISSFKDRRKYLIFNKNYVYEKSGFGNSGQFKTGGMLSKGEFDLTIFMNQSYLANGKEYWTLTSNGSNKYYIDAYIQSKSITSQSGTRVTQYVKPSTIVNGKGTYSNPWTFEEGYQVDIISNNTSFGTVSPDNPQYVRPGESLTYTLTPSNGYFYNGRKDECGLIKQGANKYENIYLAKNINRDITCTVVYDQNTYKFDLSVNSTSVDYNGRTKTYTTNPSPNPIYYKYKTNWYKDAGTKNVITKITPPTITGWTFGGYYYGSTKVIDSNGNIIVKNLNLGSKNDFVDINHTLYSNLTKNTYKVLFDLKGGKLNGSTSPSALNGKKYDEIIEINNPTRAGYFFEGWSHNGNASTAKYGNSTSSVSSTFTSNVTKTTEKYFVNLTPINGSKVTMTANWKKCPAGTYSDGSTSTCRTCPDGYTSLEAADSINKCYIDVDAGYYLVTANAKTKNVCDNGYYKTAHIVYYGQTSTCDQCPAEYRDGTTLANKTSQSACLNNVAAGYKVASSKAAETVCANGYYKAAHTVTYGQTSTCSACPDGYKDGTEVANKTAQSTCLKNVAAGYRVASAKETATACDNGYYKAAHSVTYGSTSSCEQCPAGYRDGTAVANKTAESTCLKSVAAGYKVATAKGAESKCAAGTYKTAHTLTYGQTSSCLNCSSDEWSNEGASSCFSKCNSVTYKDGTTCTKKCGGGTLNRIAYSAYDSSYRCPSDDKSSGGSACNTQTCCSSTTTTWNSWGNWTTCSKSCGTGTQSRTRTGTKYSDYNGSNCGSDSESQSQNCNTQTCCSSTTTTWNAWSDWTTCSKTCGTGTQSRTRTGTKYSDYNGSNCGSDSESSSQECNTQPCCTMQCPEGYTENASGKCTKTVGASCGYSGCPGEQSGGRLAWPDDNGSCGDGIPSCNYWGYNLSGNVCTWKNIDNNYISTFHKSRSCSCSSGTQSGEYCILTAEKECR